MSPKKPPLSKQASLDLIAADTKFFRDFALDPYPDKFRFVAALALMPFLSALMYESDKYFQKTDPSAVRAPQEDRLFWSRMRVKLTEDKYKTSAQVLEDAEELIAINSSWFLEDDRKILGWITKPLRTDIGVCRVRGEAVYTTHVAFLNLGPTKEEISRSSLSMGTLGPFMHDRMQNVGEHIRYLSRRLKIPAHVPTDASKISSPPIIDRDLKSKRLYESVTQCTAPSRSQTAILLTWMLSQINTARIIVPLIAGPNQTTAFKIRFVTLYQNALSLQGLVDEGEASAVLHPDALKKLSDVVNADPVRNILANKDLRNDLFHYGVPKRMSPQLSPNLRLFGLVEARTGGQSLGALIRDVELGLNIVADGLHALLPESLAPQRTP